jgi:NTP pyrophosphatase (non-canonical NTP hydrolase)
MTKKEVLEILLEVIFSAQMYSDKYKITFSDLLDAIERELNKDENSSKKSNS